ncbi:filamentous hemagglutinin N-terminal domain-containing protein [Candidatus Albibeggiatoa sp. nov. NOAA]|uniref:two-partner secretion domain-containing protein n=1 Tax=Candidatus Albibeggiatoa sp. nov. NOAA TaxID=3162724 RepID=UPI0033021960|nr:filamentous hemagglutinin N-terminal domain-containing protein [Thiotrichaceae bacterium]
MRVFLYLLVCLTNIAQAEISVNNQPLSINNGLYNISQDLGQTIGSNLFHSFDRFNLNQGEIAQFSGSNQIQNIISRVVGGEASFINGTIRSNIPDANFYLLNPYGIIFGAHAQLDLQGSFHASTADYVTLADGGEFHARFPERDTLSIAPVEHFGFLTNVPAAISFTNSQLSTPLDKDFSIIAGDIHISQQAKLKSSGNLHIQAQQFTLDNSTLAIERSQRIEKTQLSIDANNISILNAAHITTDAINNSLGVDIRLTANELIHATGLDAEGYPVRFYSTVGIDENDGSYGGDVILQAQDILFSNGAAIFTTTKGHGDAGSVVLNADNSVLFTGGRNKKVGVATSTLLSTDSQREDAGRSGDVIAYAKTVTVDNDAYFYTGADGNGEGGDIHLFADQIIIDHGAELVTGTAGTRNGGNIDLQAQELVALKKGGAIYNMGYYGSHGDTGNVLIDAPNVVLQEGGFISVVAYGAGNSGMVKIDAADTLSLTEAWEIGGGISSAIVSNSEPRLTGMKGGDSGNINIKARQLIMRDGGYISVSSLAGVGLQAGKGGSITVEVQENIDIQGVNPFGENENGFASGIYSRTVGDAEQGGSIYLTANSLSLRDGAQLSTTTLNQSQGGDIQVDVTDAINIIGDASHIELKPPSSTQIIYLDEYTVPTNYNQSTSGIYANSESQSLHAGAAGKISINVPKLRLQQGGTISTTSHGGHDAGNIELNVVQLDMDDRAQIASESLFNNSYQFANTAERDSALLAQGDEVEVQNIGNGKQANYINTGENLVRIQQPVDTVANMDALQQLSERYEFTEGDVITVQDDGNGQPASLIYTRYYFENEKSLATWAAFKTDANYTVDTAESLNRINGRAYFPYEDIPFEQGDRIHVKDMGDGRAGDFIFVELPFPDDARIFARLVKVNRFSINQLSELQDLEQNTSLQVYLNNYPIATLDDVQGEAQRFIYANQQWIPSRNYHTVNTTLEMKALSLAKIGDQVTMGNTEQIYTGQDWIALQPDNKTVQNDIELQHITAVDGDLVHVLAPETGRPEYYLYAHGQWLHQARGGDAGTIKINAQQLRLTQNSMITTEAISGGGGAMTLDIDRLVYLNQSQISSSVKEGLGNGGGLTLADSQFLVMNNAKLIAQAYQGQGGNIRIVADQFIKTPLSLVSASSQLGIDGHVQIDSPAENVSGGLLALNNHFSEQVAIKDTCREAVTGQLATEFQFPLSFRANMYRIQNDFVGNWISAQYNTTCH